MQCEITRENHELVVEVNRSDAKVVFQICDLLNHMVHGFVANRLIASSAEPASVRAPATKEDRKVRRQLIWSRQVATKILILCRLIVRPQIAPEITLYRPQAEIRHWKGIEVRNQLSRSIEPSSTFSTICNPANIFDIRVVAKEFDSRDLSLTENTDIDRRFRKKQVVMQVRQNAPDHHRHARTFLDRLRKPAHITVVVGRESGDTSAVKNQVLELTFDLVRQQVKAVNIEQQDLVSVVLQRAHHRRRAPREIPFGLGHSPRPVTQMRINKKDSQSLLLDRHFQFLMNEI